MLKNFLKRQSDVFYVQVWPERIKVTELNSSEVFDDAPLLAYKNEGEEKTVVSIGAASQTLGGLETTQIVNPFYRDGCVIGDVDCSIAIINHALHTITEELSGKFFSPLLIFHSMSEVVDDVGHSDDELKALLSRRCGAREVVIMKSDEYLDLEGLD